MSNNLTSAKDIFSLGRYVCVFFRKEVLFSSDLTGIRPLLEVIDSGVYTEGASVADKIIGKAAAHLLILAKVKEVYSPVMSKVAYELLTANGIYAEYDILTDAIINREGDGLCPMEQTVLNITNHDEAFVALKAKTQELAKAK